MRITTSKTKISTIALILVFTISTILIALPVVSTQEPMKMETHPYIGVSPNPVSVGDMVLIHVGISHALPNVDYGWENLTVTITRPDGETEILGPYRTDSTGGTGDVYHPNMVGNYSLQTHFPEQVLLVDSRQGAGSYPPTPAGTIMLESSSEPVVLTVKEIEREYYPGHSFPTEYWSRPIDAQLWEWNTIAGNVLASDRGTDGPTTAPYNQGPETAHILWAKPLQLGGLAGGIEFGPQSYEDGSAYEGLFLNNVIINGVLYFNRFKEQGGTRVLQTVAAVDLHTGEELWEKQLVGPDGDTYRLEFGQVFYWDSYNKHSVFAYLWAIDGTTWHAFDPLTGRWIYSMENVPGRVAASDFLELSIVDTTMFGPKGEIYVYDADLENGWMTLWNSSRVISNEGSWIRNDIGRIVDARAGIEWNITIPKGLPGIVVEVVPGDRVIGIRVDPASRNIPYDEIITEINSWGFSLKPGEEGTLLFNNSWPYPTEWLPETGVRQYLGTVSVEDGVFTVWLPELRQHWGFSIETGEPIWGPTPSQHYLDTWNTDNWAYDGKLFSSWMAGTLYVYDIKTGNTLWKYDATDPLGEVLWAGNWPLSPWIFSDGKVYAGAREHSYVDPKSRGAPFVCLDIETGEEIFRIDGVIWGAHHGGPPIMGDSILVACDGYDQRIYAVGKGASATTVSAPDMGVPLGGSVVIRGTVTDVSPGTKDSALTARFPNGVPAVADDDMSEWMLYVYKQFERPADTMGVQVKLEAYDANGNYQNLGTTITDSYGNFGFAFEPEIPGQYWISATFEGSASYYGSKSTTYIQVDEAPAPATPIEPEQPAAEAPFITTEVAIIAAVAVVAVIGVAAYWVLRKRK